MRLAPSAARVANSILRADALATNRLSDPSAAARIKSMTQGAWNIRPAAIHDARAIAEVHVESYKSAYRRIFPRLF
jgi:hypothetical protein